MYFFVIFDSNYNILTIIIKYFKNIYSVTKEDASTANFNDSLAIIDEFLCDIEFKL